MKSKAVVCVILIFFLLMVFQVADSAATGNIKWYAYKEGMPLGKKLKKKVFLHFWTKWCPRCKQMERKTFNDSAVIAYLNKNFISIKVNSDRQSALSSQYGVRGVPDNWFIAENSEAISNMPGYIPAKMFLPILKYIHTDSYKKMTFSKFIKEK